MGGANSKNRKLFERTAAVLAALLAWQCAACLVDSPWLLASPLQTLSVLCALLPQPAFWQTLLWSFVRILLGLFLALAFGALLAAASAAWRPVEILLWPFLTVMKATPVASFIILCLIWLDSGRLSVFISFLMVLPIVYTNLLTGLHSRDRRLREMAEVFGISRRERFWYLDLPQLRPYLSSACTVGTGLAWKAGLAAEVIGIPNGSVGERLYQAKIYLSTGELFAWTLAAVLCSILLEKAITGLLSLLFRRLEVKI